MYMYTYIYIEYRIQQAPRRLISRVLSYYFHIFVYAWAGPPVHSAIFEILELEHTRLQLGSPPASNPAIQRALHAAMKPSMLFGARNPGPGVLHLQGATGNALCRGKPILRTFRAGPECMVKSLGRKAKALALP